MKNQWYIVRAPEKKQESNKTKKALRRLKTPPTLRAPDPPPTEEMVLPPAFLISASFCTCSRRSCKTFNEASQKKCAKSGSENGAGGKGKRRGETQTKRG